MFWPSCILSFRSLKVNRLENSKDFVFVIWKSYCLSGLKCPFIQVLALRVSHLIQSSLYSTYSERTKEQIKLALLYLLLFIMALLVGFSITIPITAGRVFPQCIKHWLHYLLTTAISSLLLIQVAPFPTLSSIIER